MEENQVLFKSMFLIFQSMNLQPASKMKYMIKGNVKLINEGLKSFETNRM